MYYTIYKTANLINNKIYIGLHQTTNPYDSYLGSGKLLKKAVKKYGRENFKKEVLHIFTTRQDMINMEIQLVDKDFINRVDTYNLNEGGLGISKLSKKEFNESISKMKNTLQNKNLIEVSKKRIDTMIEKYGKNIFKEIGKKSSIKQKENYKNGYINPNTNINDINIYNSENIIQYTCKRQDLKELCNKYNLPERVLIKSLCNNGTPLYTLQSPRKENFKKYKNWYALYSNKNRIDVDKYLKEERQRKVKLKKDKAKTSVFNNPNKRGKKSPYHYEIHNEKGDLIHSFSFNLKEKLKELNLPINTFLYAFRNNLKIKKDPYKNWTIVKK